MAMAWLRFVALRGARTDVLYNTISEYNVIQHDLFSHHSIRGARADKL